jgi:hypothetical protein
MPSSSRRVHCGHLPQAQCAYHAGKAHVPATAGQPPNWSAFQRASSSFVGSTHTLPVDLGSRPPTAREPPRLRPHRPPVSGSVRSTIPRKPLTPDNGFQHPMWRKAADVKRSLGGRHQSERARRQGKFGTWTAKMLDPHAGVKTARSRPLARVNYDGAFCCWCGLPATSL